MKNIIALSVGLICATTLIGGFVTGGNWLLARYQESRALALEEDLIATGIGQYRMTINGKKVMNLGPYLDEKQVEEDTKRAILAAFSLQTKEIEGCRTNLDVIKEIVK